MINELIRLADRLGVTGQEAFSTRPVHWFLDLDGAGNLLGASPAVNRADKKKDGWVEAIGRPLPCPRFYFASVSTKGELSATAGGGKAPVELCAGNVMEVLGVQTETKNKEMKVLPLDAKCRKRRTAFVDLHRRAASDLPDCVALQAVSRFLGSTAKDGTRTGLTDDEIRSHFASDPGKFDGRSLSFRVEGRLVLRDPGIAEWWAAQYAKDRQSVVSRLPTGQDSFRLSKGDERRGPLAVVFPSVSGVPGGGAWCPLASFDKPPSRSYGLGKTTTAMRIKVAEKAVGALNWLLRDEAFHLRLGDSVAVFWTAPLDGANRDAGPFGFVSLLKESDPLEVRDFLQGAWGAHEANLDAHKFHAAILSSPQSRVTVRSWHTETLPAAVTHFKRWLELVTVPGSDNGPVTYSVGELAACTVQRSGKSKPPFSTFVGLFESAIFGYPLSPRFFSQALSRQTVEMAKGCAKKDRAEFEARLGSRTALIQAYLKYTQSKGETMAEEQHQMDGNVGYVLGRLLALLDKIHVEAHKGSGGTASSPANRAYGAASTTPALVFPRLLKMARYHLEKASKRWARRLEFGYPDEGIEGLAPVCARLRDVSGGEYPRTLSLEDQGRFAIGFYYERCRRWPPPKNSDGTPPGTNTQTDEAVSADTESQE